MNMNENETQMSLEIKAMLSSLKVGVVIIMSGTKYLITNITQENRITAQNIDDPNNESYFSKDSPDFYNNLTEVMPGNEALVLHIGEMSQNIAELTQLVTAAFQQLNIFSRQNQTLIKQNIDQQQRIVALENKFKT